MLTGIDNCASHIEFKLTPRGIVLIEAAARLGGGFINTDLVPLALGVDMVRAAIDVALGEPPSLEPTRSAVAAIRFLIPRPGTFGGVDGVDAVARTPGVHRVVCEYAVGETIPVVRDATGRKSHLICHATSAAEVNALVKRCAETVTFRMKADA
jgi:biotin carboxylase